MIGAIGADDRNLLARVPLSVATGEDVSARAIAPVPCRSEHVTAADAVEGREGVSDEAPAGQAKNGATAACVAGRTGFSEAVDRTTYGGEGTVPTPPAIARPRAEAEG